MAEPSSPQPNQPYRPRQNEAAKKGNPIGCLLPLGIAGFFFLQQYAPAFSWIAIVGFIFLVVVVSSTNSSKKRQQQLRQQAQQVQQARQVQQQAAQQAPPPPPVQQPQYRPQPAPPQPRPAPTPQAKPQPRPQSQPKPQPKSQPKPQAKPQPRRPQPTAVVPGTEHLSRDLITRLTDLKLKGQTVEAIEVLREATGMELYEASQIVRKLGRPAAISPTAEDTRFDDALDQDWEAEWAREDEAWEKRWRKWED